VVANEVELNLVYRSAEVGIYVNNPRGGTPTVIRQNTSTRNARCDLNDVSAGPNVWEQNRFDTACGGASQ